ncbi:tripartite tricarboxylate transporter substrate-binding protein [Fulvimarina sp. 2208YS6-2-32]|uniref:Tripartite tricarboxylate transporter substrate-binding protein n=1 Tax=Fulvimarina uroteuthidis TaxID=3098149 RepID=A0ABU5I520_9HYPH|nr:tripartite tricarboxylate transporter substrate-binding protein [Fulvimarina sp. 2208YS6-2-32]MDY8110306.1 tripartite tricarboxylate transporter substrate-binding protein [Fulvimarina sp. 2208YS6-2-32]
MKFRLFASSLVAAAFAGPVLAQDQNITIDRPECVAPAQPGGGFDLTCRIAQRGLQEVLSNPVQVTFMPGGIGAVAINLFNTTRTDDPNAIVAFSSGSILNMVTGKYGEWGADDVKFTATAGTDYGAIIVRADSEFQSLADVMTALKADISSVVLGAGGSVGSQDWMKAALLVRAEELDPRQMRYVAFDGGGDAMSGLLGGSIDIYTGDVGEVISQLEAGAVRVLAVMTQDRLPAPFADIPTTNELGYPDADWAILRGYYMGKNVSDEAYNAWVDAFKSAYGTEQWQQVVSDQGLQVYDKAGEELNQDIQRRVEVMREIAQEAGLIQ